MENTPRIGEIWQHYKTKGEYEIIGLGQLQVKIEELDMKDCVIYRSLADQKQWVRPLEDFTEILTLEDDMTAGRFAKLR